MLYDRPAGFRAQKGRVSHSESDDLGRRAFVAAAPQNAHAHKWDGQQSISSAAAKSLLGAAAAPPSLVVLVKLVEREGRDLRGK